jgi:hypothetical protein
MNRWFGAFTKQGRSTQLVTIAVAILFAFLCLFSTVAIHNENTSSLAQPACSSACLSHQQAIATYSQKLDEDEIEPTPPAVYPQAVILLSSLFLMPFIGVLYTALTKKRILLTNQLRF